MNGLHPQPKNRFAATMSHAPGAPQIEILEFPGIPGVCLRAHFPKAARLSRSADQPRHCAGYLVSRVSCARRNCSVACASACSSEASAFVSIGLPISTKNVSGRCVRIANTGSSAAPLVRASHTGPSARAIRLPRKSASTTALPSHAPAVKETMPDAATMLRARINARAG